MEFDKQTPKVVKSAMRYPFQKRPKSNQINLLDIETSWKVVNFKTQWCDRYIAGTSASRWKRILYHAKISIRCMWIWGLIIIRKGKVHEEGAPNKSVACYIAQWFTTICCYCYCSFPLAKQCMFHWQYATGLKLFLFDMKSVFFFSWKNIFFTTIFS